MDPTSYSNCVRCDIRALKGFSTEQLVAEVERRNREIEGESDFVQTEQMDLAPHIMTAEYFHRKLEQMIHLSAEAFTNRVKLYREPEDNNPINEEINDIISDSCCTYRNKMNTLLTHDKKQYTVLGDCSFLLAFLRLQETELTELEEIYSKKTVESVLAVAATRPAPEEVVASDC